MSELLLEMCCFEIPARMVHRCAEELSAALQKELEKSFAIGKVEHFYTSRRIVFHVVDCTIKNEGGEEVRGPKVSAPDKAIDGFMSRYEISDRSELTERDGYYFFQGKTQKTPQEIISSSISDTIKSYTWPSSMKWNNGDMKWIRPIQSILCTLDGEHVEVTVGEMKSANFTMAHRLYNYEQIPVSTWEQYIKDLKAYGVMLDQEDRKKRITQEVVRISKELRVKKEDITFYGDLLQEWVSLAENPSLFYGKIDDEFMQMPSELITVTLVEHQKYATVQRKFGGGNIKLQPYFVSFADFPSELFKEEEKKNIIQGNEKVLRARLADAKFYYDADLKEKLESRVDALRGFGFPVGNLHDKVKRISEISAHMMDQLVLNDEQTRTITRACFLCKADLSSGVVSEFPEMQGIIGEYYALNDGEDEEVATAIREHYMPVQSGSPLPTTVPGQVIALADRLDTLVQLFAIGIKPTGSKDPYALRRAALGAVRILSLETMRGIDLRAISVSDEVLDFMRERKKHITS